MRGPMPGQPLQGRIPFSPSVSVGFTYGLEFLHLRQPQTHFRYAHLIRLCRLLCGKAPPFRGGSHHPFFQARLRLACTSPGLPPSDLIQVHAQGFVLARAAIPATDA